jgi:hypothetical protein
MRNETPFRPGVDVYETKLHSDLVLTFTIPNWFVFLVAAVVLSIIVYGVIRKRK